MYYRCEAFAQLRVLFRALASGGVIFARRNIQAGSGRHAGKLQALVRKKYALSGQGSKISIDL